MKSKKTPLQKTPQNLKSTTIETTKTNNYYEFISLATIFILGIVIYSNSMDCSFHLDDNPSIVYNNKIQHLSDLKAIWGFSQTRFIPYLSFAINYHFGELNIWGYHFVNIFIHLINTSIIWWLVLLIFSTPAIKDYPLSKHKKNIALITALLFVSHPLATQSVTYITQRMASMAAVFYFSTMALYLQARLYNKSKAIKYLLFSGAIITAILALLSKENAYTLPFAIVMLELFFLQTKKISLDFKNYRLTILILGLAGFSFFLFTKYSSIIFKPLSPDFTTDYKTITPVNYLITQFGIIVKYIQLLILPINQTIDYDYPLVVNFFEIRSLLSFIFLLSLIIFAVILFNKNRLLSFGIFFFFLALSIESGIIPIGDLIFEHRTYLPSFGYFLILSSGIYTLLWKKHKNAAIFIFVIIIASNSFLTFSRNKIWKDEETLWTDAIAKAPEKVRPYNCRGSYYLINDKFPEAIKDFTKAIALKPKYMEAYYNRGLCYYKQNNYAAALVDFNMMIQLKPNEPLGYKSRIDIFGKENKTDLAFGDYSKLIELQPNDANNYLNRASILKNQNKIDLALADYAKAIQIEPGNSVSYYNRGLLYQNQQKNDLAILDYSKAITYKADYAEAYINRGNIESSMNEYENAMADFNKAITINPNIDLVYNNRGLLFLSANKNEEAIRDFTKALSINPNYLKAIYNRGSAYFKLGNKQSACSNWQQALNMGYLPAAETLKQYCK